MKTQQLMELQENVISTYFDHIYKQQHLSLEGNKHKWQDSSSTLKKRDRYCFINFKQALPRVEGYVDCMKKCGLHWLGLKYKFPLIWCPVKPYRDDYTLTKVEERQCQKYWATCNGYLEGGELPESSFKFSSLHEHGLELDSKQWNLFHEDMQVVGRCWVPEQPLFYYTNYIFFPCLTSFLHTRHMFFLTLSLNIYRYD